LPASFFFSIWEIRPFSALCQPHFHHEPALFLVSSGILELTRIKAQSLPEWGWQKAEWGSILPHFHSEKGLRAYQNGAGKRLNGAQFCAEWASSASQVTCVPNPWKREWITTI
jgi:hypothetical protein